MQHLRWKHRLWLYSNKRHILKFKITPIHAVIIELIKRYGYKIAIFDWLQSGRSVWRFRLSTLLVEETFLLLCVSNHSERRQHQYYHGETGLTNLSILHVCRTRPKFVFALIVSLLQVCSRSLARCWTSCAWWRPLWPLYAHIVRKCTIFAILTYSLTSDAYIGVITWPSKRMLSLVCLQSYDYLCAMVHTLVTLFTFLIISTIIFIHIIWMQRILNERNSNRPRWAKRE